MRQFIRSRILTVIIFIGAAHGILVVGPKFIRANQNYTVVISNFNSHRSKVDLMLRIEGRDDDGRNVLNLTKTVDLRRNTNRMITFNMPADLSAGNYKITIDGQRGFSFRKEVELFYLRKTISGLIQIEKPVYNPGDAVKFRVIVLDSQLKPPARGNSIKMTIRNPENIVILERLLPQMSNGMFESVFQMGSSAMLGVWHISALADGEELVSKTFEMKEFFSFDVEVKSSNIALEEHRSLNLTITANYHFGTPVKGLAKVELYLEDDQLAQEKEFEICGMGQVELRFVGRLVVHEFHQDVLVKTTFIDQYTNHTVVKHSYITVHKYKYIVELIKEKPQFRPGLPFKCALQFRYHDGTPAKGITGKVEVMEIGYETTATSDDEGLIKLELNPSDNVDDMNINFSDDDIGFFFEERVEKVDVVTNAYLKLELKSPVKLNRMFLFTVTCNERMSFFVFYVVSKGNIIDSGYMRLNWQIRYSLNLNATENMIPKAKLIVATVVSSTLVFDFVDIEFKDLPYVPYYNSLKELQVKSRQQIKLLMPGRSSAYYKNSHELLWEDIMPLHNELNEFEENEFDIFMPIKTNPSTGRTTLSTCSRETAERSSATARPSLRAVNYESIMKRCLAATAPHRSFARRIDGSQYTSHQRTASGSNFDSPSFSDRALQEAG
ncbi:thioester-containing protein 1 allele S3-like [Anopheles moucheti]|uniref:thioester-containing protein 1 allele S3-like n=1 Tax=Anopheles moucheti TaxID=186751 RepID=UPI0022F13BB1|nr:thioester-containing protein 1 allele S3-like [Anopheles moucheti]